MRPLEPFLEQEQTQLECAVTKLNKLTHNLHYSNRTYEVTNSTVNATDAGAWLRRADVGAIKRHRDSKKFRTGEVSAALVVVCHRTCAYTRMFNVQAFKLQASSDV